MDELINLALHAEDERVRSVCCVAVLDRAYGRPREMKEDDGIETRIANRGKHSATRARKDAKL